MQVGPRVLTGTVLSNNCLPGESAGFCTMPFYVDVVFPLPYGKPPSVSASFSRAVDYSGCLGGSFDSASVSVTNVTEFGFRLFAGVSPVPGYCSIHDNSYVRAYASWISTSN